MQQPILGCLSQCMEAPLCFTMLYILDDDQWIVEEEEDTLSFGLTDVTFIRTLAAVAIVPVKTGDLVNVNHLYMLNIYNVRLLMQYEFSIQRLKEALRALVLVATLLLPAPAHAADAAFTQFIASMWPEAQAAGVSRATFDTQTGGLEPDYKLPDLILPGRPATGAPSQAEFVQVPADYLKEASIARLAAEGQRLMQKH